MSAGLVRGARTVTWGVAAALLAGAGQLRAQEPPPSAPQTAEPQTAADSARARVLERLRRLARPPGADSVLYVQDSVRLAEAREGRRPGTAASGADSTVSALLSMPGFAMTEYQGGHANFGARDRVLLLRAPEEGRARVNREGMVVEADTSITYSEASGRVRTVGPSTFTPPQGDPVESGSLIYDLQNQRGSAFDARTSYSQGGARWHVGGDMPFANADSTFMSHATFTSCELEEPHYHFETDEIKIVGNSVLVARPVRLYFADVPVFWLPFVAQSLSEGRSSGLLTPRFSVNDIVRTSGGYRRRISNVGFYWAMSDYSDAIVALDWFSDNFVSITGSTQYRWNRQFLDGSVNFRRYWRADGSTELALDTRHSWEMDERTQFRVSGRYASSADFVRDNSFNPREVTQSIDSEGGLNRRFDWGSLSFAANRKQYLSDDRIEWTLPSASLSLSPVTLFRAPGARAGFFNNMTWSGSSRFTRNTISRVQEDLFQQNLASTASATAGFSSNLNLGNLQFSQSMDLREEKTLDVPEALLVFGDSASEGDLVTGAPARDVTRTNLNWSASVNYQQQLIGSTTLTPRLSFSGNRFRSDTSEVAQSFVSAPSRVSLGVNLKTDIYGFFGGFGGFEQIRHKISPSFDYQWSPGAEPTPLQTQVFGGRALQPKNTLSITLNQTWEAKRASPEDSTAAADSAAAAAEAATQDGEPRRVQRAQAVSLLAWRTSAVQYDFVEADSAGFFLAGFQTTRLSNQFSSDFLRGLSISMDHDLFEDSRVDGELERSFAPHLSQVNLSYGLSSRSGIFRLLGGLFGAGGEAPDEELPPEEEEPLEEDFDPFAAEGVTDESSIVPSGRGGRTPQQPARGGRRGWNLSLSYSLQRPRDETRSASQMLNGTLTMSPTQQWDLSWRTAYDLERGQFNDHTIRLTRDLHRWKANFDFLQTATGNWTFRFEVSLIDNQDLKFDYEQRNLDVGLPADQRRR